MVRPRGRRQTQEEGDSLVPALGKKAKERDRGAGGRAEGEGGRTIAAARGMVPDWLEETD